MARSARSSIDDVVKGAVREAIAQGSTHIVRVIAKMAADELERQLSLEVRGGRRHRTLRSSRTRANLTKWIADRRARRVPNFVIEATGLDTKKKIVARFGANATFEKGKPAPKPLSSSGSAQAIRAGGKEAARTLKAKPPIVRKSAAPAK